jgi:hypothetical protein
LPRIEIAPDSGRIKVVAKGDGPAQVVGIEGAAADRRARMVSVANDRGGVATRPSGDASIGLAAFLANRGRSGTVCHGFGEAVPVGIARHGLPYVKPWDTW